jgi:hypothetical protein
VANCDETPGILLILTVNKNVNSVKQFLAKILPDLEIIF